MSTNWQVEITLEPTQTNLVTTVGCSSAPPHLSHPSAGQLPLSSQEGPRSSSPDFGAKSLREAHTLLPFDLWFTLSPLEKAVFL